MAKSRKLWLLSSPSDMFGEGLGSASSVPKKSSLCSKNLFSKCEKVMSYTAENQQFC